MLLMAVEFIRLERISRPVLHLQQESTLHDQHRRLTFLFGNKTCTATLYQELRPFRGDFNDRELVASRFTKPK